MKRCENCGVILSKRQQMKFCSNKCQIDLQYKNYIIEWKNGLVDGNKGISTKGISGHLKRYFIEKHGNKCSKCGWHKKHPITGIVPLEIDHVNGDAENNLENNLRLLCPNCHSLTPHFKNLNKGKGRKWRLGKYIKAA